MNTFHTAVVAVVAAILTAVVILTTVPYWGPWVESMIASAP